MTREREKKPDLTDRERTILRLVIQDFIETATPVGSRYISRRHEGALGLSSASIRNVLSDLEDRGYIAHPHTSAGSVPTDLGYRFYLDRLMELVSLSSREQNRIRQDLDGAQDTDQLLTECSRVLSRISRQLCIVTSPELSGGVFEKLELVPITANRILVIISITSGLVRTIMMEVAAEVRREKLEELARFLNERLAGRMLRDIRETFEERIRDARDEDTGLIRLFIDSVDKLFPPERPERVHIGGTDAILDHPEFANPKEFRGVIELLNDEDMIIHVLHKHDKHGGDIQVTVGRENKDDKLAPYGVVTARYVIGDVSGSVGMLGPKRMPYDRVIPLVDFVARTISGMFNR